MKRFEIAVCVMLTVIAWFLLPPNARAEVYISGSKDAMVLNAKNASLREIADAFGSAFKTKIELSLQTDRTITGTYSGSIRAVLLRLLEGNNYVARISADQMSIVVDGPGMKKAPLGVLADRGPPTNSTDNEVPKNTGHWGWGGSR